MASLITGRKNVQGKKEFGFPKTSFYYQPDTATLRVISLRSLKYQNSQKNSAEAKANAPDASFLKTFPTLAAFKSVSPLLIKETIFFLRVCSQQDKKKK